jgi:hypothetical protein
LNAETLAQWQVHTWLTLPQDVAYIAYPWAEAIAAQDNAGQQGVHQTALAALAAALPSARARVTLCQHPALLQHLVIFAACGVSDIFWPHTTPQSQQLAASWGLRLHRLAAHPDLTVTQMFAHTTFDDPQRPHLLADLAAPTLPSTATPETSCFALCPAEDGGNAPAVWRSLAAGAVPVLLTDAAPPEATAGLPGSLALWQDAVLFCADTAAARLQLIARLQQIAAEPARLAAHRHAAHQLWLLHGPQAFSADIHALLLRLVGDPALQTGLQSLTLQRLAEKPTLTDGEAAQVLRDACLALQTADLADLAARVAEAAASPLLTRARARLAQNHPERQEFEALLTQARKQRPATPGLITAAAPRVYFLGPRASRTPLGYAPLRRIAADRIIVADRPETADVILTGWSRDLEENAPALARAFDVQPALKLLVISEEPLWDSLWSGGFRDRDRLFDCAGTPRPYRFLNHMNAGHSNGGIFNFARIPYFLLTSDAFFTRYVPLLAAWAAQSPQAMLTHWHRAPIRAAFFAEKRTDPAFDLRFTADQVYGLSGYRTALAQQMSGPGVLRVGQGWDQPGATPAPRRQDLPDWHLDKLARLHARTRLCSALENTHQHSYVSEKVFDAFAIGAIPVVYAGPDHRLHDLVHPEAALNFYEQAENVAVARIAALTPNIAMAEAWLATACGLHALLGDIPAVLQERRRVVDACLAEILALL